MKKAFFLPILFIFICCSSDEDPVPENYASEIFFSEYIEGTGHNKALEIVNLTGKTIDLSAFSIKKKTNGEGDWAGTLALSGELLHEDVLVIINQQAELEKLQNEADLSVNSPLNFNGNDPVALFKNGELIDVIGISGGEVFGENLSLRRKKEVPAPTTAFDLSDWEILEENSVEGLGVY